MYIEHFFFLELNIFHRKIVQEIAHLRLIFYLLTYILFYHIYQYAHQYQLIPEIITNEIQNRNIYTNQVYIFPMILIQYNLIASMIQLHNYLYYLEKLSDNQIYYIFLA